MFNYRSTSEAWLEFGFRLKIIQDGRSKSNKEGYSAMIYLDKDRRDCSPRPDPGVGKERMQSS